MNGMSRKTRRKDNVRRTAAAVLAGLLGGQAVSPAAEKQKAPLRLTCRDIWNRRRVPTWLTGQRIRGMSRRRAGPSNCWIIPKQYMRGTPSPSSSQWNRPAVPAVRHCKRRRNGSFRLYRGADAQRGTAVRGKRTAVFPEKLGNGWGVRLRSSAGAEGIDQVMTAWHTATKARYRKSCIITFRQVKIRWC